jgi:23S rRNA pseudoU1915 N3-methylase RlmH
MIRTTLIFITLLGLVACGPTEKEIQDTIKVTCNIVSVSETIATPFRIKAVNEAREKIKGEPFLGSEADIFDASRFGLCEQLVVDDPQFSLLLEEKRKIEKEVLAEQKRIEEEKKVEAAKIAAEKKAEEQRIAAEKKAEEQRVAAEKKAEEERLVRESFVCTMTNEKRKKMLQEEICDELMTTRRMDSNLRFEIARKYGFGVKGATYLTPADRIEANCGFMPGLIIGLACVDNLIQELKKSD